MTLHPDLLKWIYASVSVMLKPVVEDELGIKFYVEGVDRETDSAFENESVLLRIVGPTYIPGQGEDRYKVEVLALVTNLPGHNQNAYMPLSRGGTLANNLSSPIPIKKYGDGEEHIGCLDIDRDSREFVRVVNYGLIEKDLTVHQVGVVANYEITL